MKKINMILMAFAVLTLGSCSHAIHFDQDMPQDENTSKYPAPDGLGYLGNDLAWEDIADIKSEIANVKYVISGANGVLEHREFGSPEEASELMIPLPVGEYDVLVAANMDASNGFEISGTAPTKVSHTLPATYASLTDESSNPVQAWNGIAHVIVEKDKMTTVHLEINRLLALFTLRINNVPEGTVIDVSMRNSASYVVLTEEVTSGYWGMPGADISDDITLGQLNASNAVEAIDEFKVFPTAEGVENTILMFHIKTNKGLDLDYVGEAPRMENGRKYVLDMDYNTLTPFMYITGTSINDWTDGWSVDGEILNPHADK